MKLFIWSDPYNVAYGSSMFFAVAETVEEARKIAVLAPGYTYQIHPADHPQRVELGEPTRVVDCPCGEWHEQSE